MQVSANYDQISGNRIPTLITWSLIIFGVVINLPLFYAQVLMARQPQSQKTKDLIIGKGDDRRDKTHLRSSYGIAWADLIILFPLLAAGIIGVVLGKTWGYILWAAAGAIMVYINIILWFSERQYVLPCNWTVGLLYLLLGIFRALGSTGGCSFSVATDMTF